MPYLTILLLVPAIGAGVIALIPGRHKRFIHCLGIGISLTVLGFAAVMACRFKANVSGYQFQSNHVWATVVGARWHLGLDGISLFLVIMTAVLFPIAMAGAMKREKPRAFLVWMLLLEAACIGSFTSLDLLLFFFFFELTLVPSYFIIAGFGRSNRAYAAIKFFIYTFAGSAFLLVGIVALVLVHHDQTGVFTFSLTALMKTHMSRTTQILLFLPVTAAFVVKAPLFPFHTWSPDAYGEAPTAGSMVLAGVLAKIGTYGILRFDLNLFPVATHDLAPIFMTLAVIGILYGAAVACAQRDMKRLVAYSSLAQMGFVALGIFSLNAQAIDGAVLLMLNHGIITAALFLAIGWIYKRRRTFMTNELKGLQRPAPILAAVFTIVMLASIGLPGLNGFVSEFLILIGTFVAHRWWAVAATAGVIVAAIYLLWAYQQVFHGTPSEETKSTKDLSIAERIVIAPLIILIVVLGVYPRPVLARIEPSVNQLVAHVHQAVSPVHEGVAKSNSPSSTNLAPVSKVKP